MSIIMALWVLFGFGQMTPLNHEEVLTKEQNERCYQFEQSMNAKGMGETWKHSQPQSMSADREIERQA